MKVKVKYDANNVNMKVKLKCDPNNVKNESESEIWYKEWQKTYWQKSQNTIIFLFTHQSFAVIHFFTRGRVVAFWATTSSLQMMTPFIQGSHQSPVISHHKWKDKNMVAIIQCRHRSAFGKTNIAALHTNQSERCVILLTNMLWRSITQKKIFPNFDNLLDYAWCHHDTSQARAIWNAGRCWD